MRWVMRADRVLAIAAVALLAGGLACSDKNADGATTGGSSTAGGEAPGGAGGSPGAAGTGTGTGTGAGSGAGSGSGTGGMNAGSGGSGNAGAGAGDASTPQPEEDGGTGETECEPACPASQRCELVQVQCVRAPCPPQPMCVEASGSGRACGSRGLGECAQGEFCDHPISANCGATDAPGECRTLPRACTREFNPVCGCDGQTYSNPCEAASAGVSVQRQGACDEQASLRDCNTGHVTCRMAEPDCAEGNVPSVSGTCWGPCVALESCACNGPEDCPNPDTYTCHMSAGHCGPYV